MNIFARCLLGVGIALAGFIGPAWAQSRTLILATTTSTQDSGLLDLLVPIFEKKTGYTVKTIAVGTGQSLAMAARGDADVVLAHAPTLEKRHVQDRKSTRLNSSHIQKSRMPSSA